MKNFFSRLFAGAGIGFMFGGPLGAILGAALAGSMSDINELFGGEARTDRDKVAFTSNLVVLLTLVAKADGTVSPEEARAIADFFKHELHFGEQQLTAVRKIMKETLRINPPAGKVAAEFARISTREERLALLRLVWMIAAADGRIDPSEERIIAEIAEGLGIDERYKRSVGAEFGHSGNGYYETLGLTSEASNEEIKAAYRKMAKQYHPDRVAHLGEDYTRLANEKFSQINQAYDAIRRQRGF